ncbi:MAG: hypothetical protein GKR91_19110 [Pseudomonadales bacterium]|nr:hypothetical protein [Pseudomonadales bacterium]
MALVFTKKSEISLFNLTGSDRLGRYITLLSIKYPVASVVIACLLGFIAPGIAFVEGNWSNPSLELDVVRDLGWWNQFLLAFPALVYLSGAYLGAFPRTLRHLVNAGVILASEAEWKAIRRSTKDFVSHPAVSYFPYFFGLLVATASTLLFLTGNSWIDVRFFLAGWLVPFQVFLLYYFLAYIALRIVSVYLVLSKLFRLNVNIQPFHADGCGGLKSLSNQSSRLTVTTIAFGVIITIAMYTNIAIYELNPFGVYNLLMFSVYVVVAVLSFFLPLYATSTSMQAAKQHLIGLITEREEKLGSEQNLSKPDQKNLNEYGEEDLKALLSLKQTVRAMQVWPFTPGAIVRFFGSVAIPILVISVQVLVNL